jgi:hypothetical protein
LGVDVQTLIEYVEESNLYAMDFSATMSQLTPGETLSTLVLVESDPVAGLTITEKSLDVNGKRVLFRITPDTAGSYEIRVKATTSQGNTKQGKGTLLVEEL